jgi:hypothetical protein
LFVARKEVYVDVLKGRTFSRLSVPVTEDTFSPVMLPQTSMNYFVPAPGK